MKTVREMAKCSGISVRTLHYYDQIGLLKPSAVTDAGYRLYGNEAQERLLQILYFREMELPLAEIRNILDNPSFDSRQAMENHRSMLILRRDRLNRLILLAEKNLRGESILSFLEFDNKEIEAAQKKYAVEAAERWGDMKEYQEYIRRMSKYDENDWKQIQRTSDEIFRAFAKNLLKAPGDTEVQDLVAMWKKHISQNFYACSNEILAGLGEMYISDERFTDSINSQYGDGVAQFIGQAIQIFCS